MLGDEKVETLTIAVSEDGRIWLTGPIANKFLCYSMLNRAKKAVKEYHGERPQSLIPERSSTS